MNKQDRKQYFLDRYTHIIVAIVTWAIMFGGFAIYITKKDTIMETNQQWIISNIVDIKRDLKQIHKAYIWNIASNEKIVHGNKENENIN